VNVREPDYQENNLLFENFIKSLFGRDYYYKVDKSNSYWGAIEIMLSPVCNLSCKYCYIHRHRDKLYPESLRDRTTILKNLKILLNWLTENEYNPRLDLFSGDPLTIELGLEALEIIVDHYRDVAPELRPEYITIPSNFSFLLDDELVNRIETLMLDYQQIGMRILLSASLDGPILENDTRPFTLYESLKSSGKQTHIQMLSESSLTPFRSAKDANKARDDEFYEKAFSFAEKHKGCVGFHPMIYSVGIDKWKDNFLWYQSMFRKYNIRWSSLYLLEVRNTEWTISQAKEFRDLMKFLVRWQWEVIYRKDTKQFIDNIFNNGEVLNITRSPFERTSRGIGCSFQTMLYIRMGDLAIVPCHRTSYDHLVYGKFKTHNNRIVGFESNNVEAMIQGITFNTNNLPFCQTCLIKNSCHGGCLGAQFEETGSMYVPIPTVCRLEHAKVLGVLEGINEIGGLGYLFGKLRESDPTLGYSLEKLVELKGGIL